MTENDFREYIESIRNTEEFKQLIAWIGIKDDQNLLEALVNYLSKYHARTDTKEFFVPDFEHFRKFFECYRKNLFEIIYTKTGEIDLANTPYLKTVRSVKRGTFTDCYILMPNKSQYILKKPLNYVYGKSGVTDAACKYNAIIGEEIAKMMGVTTSENDLFQISNGQNRTGSKYFLRHNEEMVTFFEDEDNIRISDILTSLNQSLQLRRFSESERKKAEFEFLKQEFLAKLIDLDDQANDNTGLIISTDEHGNRSIRLTPMFDYDFSFSSSQHSTIARRACDNEKTDIGSLIRQYKDYPGFMDFVRNSLSVLDMNKVYDSIFTNKHLTLFQPPHDNNTLKKFTEFVNRNLTLAKDTVKQLDENAREELL